jgi:D-arabinose 1-dehydrogenase-like Zn-dependent alcohol dehydrogenase
MLALRRRIFQRYKMVIMFGWQVVRPGEPLNRAEMPDPVPGPGELLVAVDACGVCRTDLHVSLRVLDRGGTLAVAGIYLTDIPSLNYDRDLFQERRLLSVTSNTRDDGRDLLAFAEAHPLRVSVDPYPMSRADEALAALAAGQVSGAASRPDTTGPASPRPPSTFSSIRGNGPLGMSCVPTSSGSGTRAAHWNEFR